MFQQIIAVTEDKRRAPDHYGGALLLFCYFLLLVQEVHLLKKSIYPFNHRPAVQIVSVFKNKNQNLFFRESSGINLESAIVSGMVNLVRHTLLILNKPSVSVPGVRPVLITAELAARYRVNLGMRALLALL